MARTDRYRHPRRRAAHLQARLRLALDGTGRRRDLARTLRRHRNPGPHRRRRAHDRSGRSVLRPRLDRRPPGRPAHARAHPAHARRHPPRSGRSHRQDPPRTGAMHRGKGRHQRRHGRVPARVHAGRAHSAGGRAGPRLHPARRHLQHLLFQPGDHRQRPHRHAPRHELRAQRARTGEPGQRHDRPRGQPRGPQRGRRAARRNRPRDVGFAGQVHLLFCGG